MAVSSLPLPSTPTSTLPHRDFMFSSTQTLKRVASGSTFTFNGHSTSPSLCQSNNEAPGLVDQILDYIEGGPKLRKWYGAPNFPPKDAPSQEENESSDELMTGKADDKPFLKKVLRGVRAVICPKLSVYSGSSGIQALLRRNLRKLAEEEETILIASGVPYTIIRVGMLVDTPGRKQGFSFEEGRAAKGSLRKEDATFVCVEALNAVSQTGLIFEVVNEEDEVLSWKEHLVELMDKSGKQL